MSFVSNKRTRRTERACTHGTSFKSVLATTGSAPIDDTRFNRGTTSAVRNQTAETTSIGSHNSRGLVIHGGSVADSFQYPTDADGNVPPGFHRVDGQSTAPFNGTNHPKFPITYSGPGHLDFQSGFSVPYIIGSTEIKGDLLVHGSLRVTNTFGPSTAMFLPVIKDALGNELDGAVVTGSSYKLIDFGDYFECCISWTGTSLIDLDEAMYLTGFPATYYSNLSFGTVHPDRGLYTINTGATIACKAINGSSSLEFVESDTTSADPRLNVHGEQFDDGPGSMCIRGLLAHA